MAHRALVTLLAQPIQPNQTVTRWVNLPSGRLGLDTSIFTSATKMTAILAFMWILAAPLMVAGSLAAYGLTIEFISLFLGGRK